MENSQICKVTDLSKKSANSSIKVWLVYKSRLRTTHSGLVKFFKMELQDASGEIGATAFDDKYFGMLKVGKFFHIQNFKVNKANKRFNTLSHRYKITFNNSTRIYPSSDEGVPKATYNFKEISQLDSVGLNDSFDLIGVCQKVGKMQQRGERQKRLLTLVDRSMAAVNVEVWNDEAALFGNNQHPVVFVKTGRINEYDGKKSVNTKKDLMIDPDIEKAKDLKSWFSEGGSANIYSNIFEDNVNGNMRHNHKLRKKWTGDELRLLIKMVEERPPIWNNKIDGYKNRHKKEKCWSEISDATKYCIADCKLQFKVVRSRYNAEHKKINASKSEQDGITYVSKYEHFAALQFLDTVRNRESGGTKSNFETLSSSAFEDHQFQNLESHGSTASSTPAKRIKKQEVNCIDSHKVSQGKKDISWQKSYGEYVAQQLSAYSESNARRLRTIINNDIDSFKADENN